MSFPPSPRVVYKQNPLVQVICQLKFPTILEIGSTDPADFQKHVRRKYPIYHRQTDPAPLASRIPKEFGDLVARLGVPLGRLGPHRFANEDETRSISLSPEFVAITEDSYMRWEELRTEIDLMLKALVEVYEPPFFNRIGLRYRDEINRIRLGLEGEPWKNLIKPELLGLLGVDSLEDLVLESQFNSLCSIEDAASGARMRINQSLPAESQGHVYTIDIDLFIDGRTEVNDVIPILDKLNRTGGDFFRWAITDKLANTLEPQPI